MGQQLGLLSERWFDADPPRQERHPEAFDELLLAEGEREQLAERAGNSAGAARVVRRSMANASSDMRDDYAALEEAELIEREQIRIGGARRRPGSSSSRWFADDAGRSKRHPERFEERCGRSSPGSAPGNVNSIRGNATWPGWNTTGPRSEIGSTHDPSAPSTTPGSVRRAAAG